ncbi:endonuclease/exonuclease/phosphatase family protein [Amycolatopsis benzoatilytica]|uniref:endonuclease/exonuclease/phosphatase family protein n=1 Tax=Amycolatopsis benzoatilytica TaxID=346045 RepID=UPI000368343E|nr:endonuclease/exonuclease/phosphatase family protein [Amycolatopsis benzoatilytica]
MAVVAAVSTLAAVVPAQAVGVGRPLSVMTRNLDSGSDYGPIFAAQTAPELVQATTEVWQEVQASGIPERMGAIAGEIAAAEPDVVSLQEAELYRTGPLSATGTPQAQNVAYDQLSLLMNGLAARDAHYRVVAALDESDVEAPTLLGYDVRMTDRDALLVRDNAPANLLSTANVHTGHFTAELRVPTPLGIVPVVRGWISADVTSLGRTTRVLATHLEAFSAEIATAQAAELLTGPGGTSLPLVAAADFNTGPGVSATYSALLGYGLTDTWTATNPAQAGNTWPLHLEDPATAESTPTQRIDLVLERGLTPVADSLLGAATADLTPSGLWPSDHAGVLATLRLAAAKK